MSRYHEITAGNTFFHTNHAPGSEEAKAMLDYAKEFTAFHEKTQAAWKALDE